MNEVVGLSGPPPYRGYLEDSPIAGFLEGIAAYPLYTLSECPIALFLPPLGGYRR